MRKYLPWTFIVLLLAVIPSAGAEVPLSEAVDQYIRSQIQEHHIPGLALAVVKDGRVEKLAGYGLANVETATAVTPQTLFQIQSVTKTFTSSAILLLAEEGKLSIDDSIGKQLPGTPESWNHITLRHLLSHTSGIKDFINEPTASLRLDVSEEDVFKATIGRPLNFQPGEKYAYSNTNYHLLAMIIHRITGKPYGQFLSERIFTPLDMSATRINSLSDIIPNRASGYAFDHGTLHNGGFVAGSILAYGGGGIVSSAEDMARWALALDGEKVLKKTSFETAWTPTKLNSDATSRYGLGWNIGTINGHRLVSHGGSHHTGFTSALMHYRDDELSVIVLTNCLGANPSRIASHIAGLYVPALMPAEPDTKTHASAPATNPAWPPLHWKRGAPSPFVRVESPTAVVDGKMYLFGGFVKGLGASNELDVYDPATDAWKRLKDMPTRVTHLNPAIDRGTIWLAGGFKGKHPGPVTDEVWKYDIASDTWSSGPPLPEPRAGGGLVVAAGKLHYFGGFKSDRDTNSPDHWSLPLDGSTTWQREADFPEPRGHVAAAVLDGKIYALGGTHGHDKTQIDLKFCHRFDPATGKWSEIASFPDGRSHFEGSTIVHNGRILIIAGRCNSSTPKRNLVDDIMEYDPKTDTWRIVGAIPVKLMAPSAALIAGNLIVTGGGLNNPQPLTDATWIGALPAGE